MIVLDTGFIPLRNRDGSIKAWALVDAEDYADLAAFTWHLSSGYVARNLTRGPRRTRPADGVWAETMARRVMGLQARDPREADHINRDPLDNRKANLRVCTRGQNMQNRSSYRGAASQYRGVTWHKGTGKWVASCRVDGRLHNLGYFHDEAEAATVAADFRREHLPFSVETGA